MEEKKPSRPILSLRCKRPAPPKVGGPAGKFTEFVVSKTESGLAVVVNKKAAESGPARPEKPKKPKKVKKREAIADSDKVAFLNVDEIRSLCISKWPMLFDVERGLIPLKVGIREDILADLKAEGLRASRKAINRFLREHCRMQPYLAMLQNIPDTARWGLHGELSELTEEARAYSARKAWRFRDR